MAEKGKLDWIEERIRAIEGGEDYGFADMEDLCLVPDVVILPKFKVPDFDKYKGTTCPKNHMKMYCRKMGAYAKDEKLLMHFFQESLTGEAITWYTNLKPSQVHSLKDLMVAFIRKYRYNSDMTPDRMQLQNMCKKENESFKEYAQRWRDMTAQVAPPMMEKEMITMIVDTLPVFYYEKMVGYTPSNFADLVFAGERIEVGLRRGNFDYHALMDEKAGANEENKKEGGTHAVTVVPTWPNFPPAQQCHYSANISSSHYPPPNQSQRPSLNQPQRPPLNQPNTTLNTNQNTNQGGSFPVEKPVEFTPILVSYANLLPYLLDNSIVVVTPAKVPQPPFSEDTTRTQHVLTMEEFWGIPLSIVGH